MADDQAEFWSKVAHHYDQVVDLQLGGLTRSKIRERVMQEDGLGNVAEFGCGTGFYTAALAGRAERVVATDLSAGMLSLARQRVKASNVSFQLADIQNTSFRHAVFDTTFMSLVIHFTDPGKTLTEMHRILRSGGTLIVANLDPRALNSLNRARSIMRIVYHGVAGYRVKPPKHFGANMLTGHELGERLRAAGFDVASSEMIKDSARSSNIPVEYVRAIKP